LLKIVLLGGILVLLVARALFGGLYLSSFNESDHGKRASVGRRRAGRLLI
jgi:hypothetical protein